MYLKRPAHCSVKFPFQLYTKWNRGAGSLEWLLWVTSTKMTFENLPTVPVSQKKESVLALWRRTISCRCHKHYLLPSYIRWSWMIARSCQMAKGNWQGFYSVALGDLFWRADVINDTLINIYMCMCVCICVNTQVPTKYFYLRNRKYLDCILCEMCF